MTTNFTSNTAPVENLYASYYYNTYPNIWGAGQNNAGQLGNLTTTNSNTFITTSRTGTPTNYYTKIMSGFYHNLALKNDGTLWVLRILIKTRRRLGLLQ